MTVAVAEKCRLCEGEVEPLFHKQQLGKYEVQYFRCIECESVQTEYPYWTEEAYGQFDFAADTGIVHRVLFCSSVILALALKEGFSREDYCLDVGGGTGLLTRILRDYGLNAHWRDKYCANVFAKGFEGDVSAQGQPAIISACEVWEHLVEPSKELAQYFEAQPRFIFCSTKLYAGQDKSWWYFNQDGQHVQFFSKKAMHWIASKYNYHYQGDGSIYHLFSKTNLPHGFLKKLLKKQWTIFAKAHKRWPSRIGSDAQLMSD